METTRQQKIARLIQKEIADMFQTEPHLLQNSKLLTVTHVNVTKDLSIARIYVSVFSTNDKQEVLDAIERSKKDIRFKLGQRIRNQVRSIPELTFFIDDTLDYLENIDNLLKQ